MGDDLWDLYWQEGREFEQSEPSRALPYGRPPARPMPPPEPVMEPSGKHWAENEPKGFFEKGFFDWKSPENRGDDKIDRLVSGWVKDNPHNMVDILTGMYGLTGGDEGLQRKVLEAIETGRILGDLYPARKSTEAIGRKIESFMPTEKNFFSFKQGLLNVVPETIEKARKKGQNDKADLLIRLADQIYAI